MPTHPSDPFYAKKIPVESVGGETDLFEKPPHRTHRNQHSTTDSRSPIYVPAKR